MGSRGSIGRSPKENKQLGTNHHAPPADGVRMKSKGIRRPYGMSEDAKKLVSLGWNGFPRGLNDEVPERHDRPLKYKWTEHAERNAIYNAAAKGHPLLRCTIYLNWYPCADCARAIIQAGITEIVCYEPDWQDERWGADFRVVKEMLDEVGMKVRFL